MNFDFIMYIFMEIQCTYRKLHILLGYILMNFHNTNKVD